jgi:hypothetical protein
MSKKLIKVAENAVAEASGRRGLRELRPGVFELDFALPCGFFAGFSVQYTTSDPGSATAFPRVGIWHEPTERLLADIRQTNFKPLDVMTLALNPGYIQGRSALIFYCREHEDTHVFASAIIESVRTLGLPYVKKLTLNDSLCELANLRHFSEPQYRYPVALAAFRRTRDAGVYVAEQIERLGTRTDESATRYKDFAKRLIERQI